MQNGFPRLVFVQFVCEFFRIPRQTIYVFSQLDIAYMKKKYYDNGGNIENCIELCAIILSRKTKIEIHALKIKVYEVYYYYNLQRNNFLVQR